jgi:predicted phage tail protein
MLGMLLMVVASFLPEVAQTAAAAVRDLALAAMGASLLLVGQRGLPSAGLMRES